MKIAKSRFDILAAIAKAGTPITLQQIASLCPDLAGPTVATAAGECKKLGLITKIGTAGAPVFTLSESGREVYDAGFTGRVVASGDARVRAEKPSSPPAAPRSLADIRGDFLDAMRAAPAGDFAKVDWVNFAREVQVLVAMAQPLPLGLRLAGVEGARETITQRSYHAAFEKIAAESGTPQMMADDLGVSLTTVRRWIKDQESAARAVEKAAEPVAEPVQAEPVAEPVQDEPSVSEPEVVYEPTEPAADGE